MLKNQTFKTNSLKLLIMRAQYLNCCNCFLFSIFFYLKIFFDWCRFNSVISPNANGADSEQAKYLKALFEGPGSVEKHGFISAVGNPGKHQKFTENFSRIFWDCDADTKIVFKHFTRNVKMLKNTKNSPLDLNLKIFKILIKNT